MDEAEKAVRRERARQRKAAAAVVRHARYQAARAARNDPVVYHDHLMGSSGLLASRITSGLSALISVLDELGEVPIGVLLETENWEAKIARIRELSKRQP